MKYAEADGSLSAVTAVGYALPDGTVEPVRAVWEWVDGVGWVRHYINGLEYFDDFNRSALGPRWFDRLMTGSAAAVLVNNSVRAGDPAINSDNQNAVVWLDAVATDDMVTEADTVTTPPNNAYMGVMLRADAAGESFVLATASGAAATSAILTYSGGTLTERARYPQGQFAAGDTLVFRAVGNVYTVSRRRGGVDTVLGSWTDTAGVVSRGPARRHGGVYVVSFRSWTSTTYGPRADNFRLYDASLR